MKTCVTEIKSREIATVFDVNDDSVVGVLHDCGYAEKTGVLFIVGGRQYRTGAQRQFVRLARHLAENRFSVFRFDVRGMGDSAAAPLHFLDTTHDITAAIAEFRRLAPQVERIILWGLCDGASAAINYAAEDATDDINSVMMVNPWITTDSGAARTTLKHHYVKRAISADFWRKVFAGEINVLNSLLSLGSVVNSSIHPTSGGNCSESNLPDTVFSAIEKFTGNVTVVMSEKDLTAREFRDEYGKRYSSSNSVMPFLRMIDVEADHTFSTLRQHMSLERLTLDWCQRHQAN